ncbi:hypothetical protein EPN52_05300 [bacterium]|nr:MAG: hypothetical protein EPN52_05300 [bacterium]
MFDATTLAESLVDAPSPAAKLTLSRRLSRFGLPALRLARARGVRVVALARGERYTARSPRLRDLAPHLDTWPAPPAGLFVVEERTAYLRSRSPLAVAHEFGHALDCALGDGGYRSSEDRDLRTIYFTATSFITPYAATAPDEFFAEIVRAYVEANDHRSPWPAATRHRLRDVDVRAFDYVERLFARDFIQALTIGAPRAYSTP